MFRYTTEMNEFILDHREGRTLLEITEAFNWRFGTDVTVSQMRAKFKNMRIHVGQRSPIYSEVWSPAAAEIFNEVNQGRTSMEVARILTERTGRRITKEQVQAYRKNHHIPCGVDTRFKQGMEPWTKGKSIEEICKTPEALARVRGSQYKPGSKPWNHMPVGSEVFKYGYWWVKTGEPNHWKAKHRIIFEKENGIKLGRDDVITFLDGDTSNMDKGNMVLLSNRENLEMNRSGMRSEDPSITRTGVAVAKLMSAIREREEKDDKKQAV